MTTEWEDVQRKFGNLPPLETAVEEPKLEQLVVNVAEEKAKSLMVSDEDDDDDELELIRRRRMEKLRESKRSNVYGSVATIRRSEFDGEVVKAPIGTYVVCHLIEPSMEISQKMQAILRILASRNASVKFVEIDAQECSPGWPESAIPSLLIYKDGKIDTQLTGASTFGGSRMSLDDVEWKLHIAKVVETELEEDPMIQTGRFVVNIHRKQGNHRISEAV